VVGGIIVLIFLEDVNARWDDVSGQVVEEGHIAIHKGVIGHEGVKVRARKYGDLLVCTVEVGSDGVLWVMTFVLCNVDEAAGSRAGGLGDVENDASSWMHLLGGGVV
jgi:hypothetical protein